MTGSEQKVSQLETTRKYFNKELDITFSPTSIE